MKPNEATRPLPGLLCARKRDVAAGKVIPPEIRETRCTGCGAAVLMSPASAVMVRRGECRPVCKTCIPPAASVALMTGEQLAELSKYAGDP